MKKKRKSERLYRNCFKVIHHLKRKEKKTTDISMRGTLITDSDFEFRKYLRLYIVFSFYMFTFFLQLIERL